MEVKRISGYDLAWWKDPVVVCGVGRDSWFDKNVAWKVGDGMRLKLWHFEFVENFRGEFQGSRYMMHVNMTSE